VIIAYFTLLAGPAPTPVLVVKDQPIAYKSGAAPSFDAKVEVVVANIGTAQVTLHDTNTKLDILGPFTATASLGSSPTIAPGESKTLTFTFNGAWGTFDDYRSASARLVLKDTAGNTVGTFEVSIRIIGGG
jgi:hypothetical protein